MGGVNSITGMIFLLLWLGALGMTLFALIHAVRQRPDAFTAVDKLSKPAWVGILCGALLFLLIAQGFFLLMIIAVIASGVYLADVRPKVDEVQRGPRW
ncbi:DUF2516 family protein [Nocardia sp. CC227C]|uniref:DUF2516 family protein n=1 Tax=Nocardia sp. CC227C TaxID=3044562 RepID=UPI00278BDEAB|nr:DUF2516 family protein [Nocardia sp. CC227C]